MPEVRVVFVKVLVLNVGGVDALQCMVNNLSQYPNALEPISVTFAGIVTVSKELQKANVWWSIFVTWLGILIVLIFEQLKKASHPMEVTLLGISKDFKL